MSTMFIGNGSQQNIDFTYRLPGDTKTRVQRIEIGHQVKLSGDLSVDEVSAIIKQYHKYGMICVDELEGVRSPHLTLIFSLDKPIPAPVLQHLMERNLAGLIASGKKMREDAAMVIATELGKTAREFDNKTELDEVELEIVEEDEKGKTNDDPVLETVVVTPENKQPRQEPRDNRNNNNNNRGGRR